MIDRKYLQNYSDMMFYCKDHYSEETVLLLANTMRSDQILLRIESFLKTEPSEREMTAFLNNIGGSFLRHSGELVKYIVLDDDPWFYDSNFCDSGYVFVAVGDEIFKIGSQYIDDSACVFTYTRVENLPAGNAKRIISTKEEPLRFIRLEKKDGSEPVLRFQLGERPVLITADIDMLMVGLSHWDVNGEWIEYENKELINDSGEPTET